MLAVQLPALFENRSHAHHELTSSYDDDLEGNNPRLPLHTLFCAVKGKQKTKFIWFLPTTSGTRPHSSASCRNSHGERLIVRNRKVPPPDVAGNHTRVPPDRGRRDPALLAYRQKDS